MKRSRKRKISPRAGSRRALAHQIRSKSSKKGWATRRRREAAEFKRRSKASKKGWRRKRRRADIAKKAKAKPTQKGKLAEWLVNWAYTSLRGTKVNRGNLHRQVN